MFLPAKHFDRVKAQLKEKKYERRRTKLLS